MTSIMMAPIIHRVGRKPVAPSPYEVEDGCVYVKVTKKASWFLTLVQQGDERLKSLSRTDIVEQLIKLRDDAIEAFFAEQTAKDDAPDELLGVVPTRPKKRSRAAAFMLAKPRFVAIVAPSFDDIASQSMRVRYAKKNECLWLELSPDIVDYLTVVVNMQLEEGNIHRPHASSMVDNPVIVDCNGVSFSYTRNKYRVTTPKVTKYFPIDEAGPSDAEEQAIAFLNANATTTTEP
jgi:hypothetical protein